MWKFLKAWFWNWAQFNILLDVLVIAAFLIVSFIRWRFELPEIWDILTISRITLAIALIVGFFYCFSDEGQKEWR
jgi:hypothetical protein